MKQGGKVDSCKQRLIRVVIGVRRVSRHDLRTTVGMKSSEQVAVDDARMAARTSAVVVGVKCDSEGGDVGGVA